MLLKGNAHTPEASKHVAARPVPDFGGIDESWNTPPVTCVPGARRSGFVRPSAQGPRPENVAMSLALSASASSYPQRSSPVMLFPPAEIAIGCTFSAAPTVMTFFAVPGEVMVCPAGPELPAEN